MCIQTHISLSLLNFLADTQATLCSSQKPWVFIFSVIYPAQPPAGKVFSSPPSRFTLNLRASSKKVTCKTLSAMNTVMYTLPTSVKIIFGVYLFFLSHPGVLQVIFLISQCWFPVSSKMLECLAAPGLAFHMEALAGLSYPPSFTLWDALYHWKYALFSTFSTELRNTFIISRQRWLKHGREHISLWKES